MFNKHIGVMVMSYPQMFHNIVYIFTSIEFSYPQIAKKRVGINFDLVRVPSLKPMQVLY